MRPPPVDVLAARAVRLRGALAENDVDLLVVTSLPNLAYLTGLSASAGALIGSAEGYLVLCDARYTEAAQARAREWPAITAQVLDPGLSLDDAIAHALRPMSGLRMAFESPHMSVSRHHRITAALAADGANIGLTGLEHVVERLRIVKDPWEIGRVREGAARLSDVANSILTKRLVGKTEFEVASMIDGSLRRAGFERPAFDTIVAAGARAAQPHAQPTGNVIGAGELVVLDFGGVLDGYCTDLSRTVVAGRAGRRERQLIARVIEAQAAAFAAVAPGAGPEGVDGAARTVLEGYGLGAAFTHGTGHGLGLEIHEAPRVTRLRVGHSEPVLEAGMVMTLEPGVYLPGFGGVRIEDDVLVTEGGAEWLTSVPRAR
ncbi:MAG: M24 family metallopeptidase [Acidobacteriota bacterium]